MADDYVTAKVKEALLATSGDQKAAVKLLLTWAVRDLALLIGLSKPHLKAEVTARVHAEAKAKKGGDDEQTPNPDLFSASERRHPSKTPPPKKAARRSSVAQKIARAFKKKK